MNYKRTVQQILGQADIQIGGKRPQDIIVNNDDFYKRVLREGELGLGESYMDGWWDAKQLDEFIAHILQGNVHKTKQALTPNLLLTVASAKLLNRQTIKRAKRDVSYHYNIGNDLYEKMLDPNMLYTCAYWKDAKNLEQAQINKMDLVCRKLQLKKGMTVLDVGCGWGGFAIYAAKNYGVKVTAVTLASEQAKLAAERAKGLNVKILNKDYRDVTGKFDRVVSIGIMEHIGGKNYQSFLRTCETLLKPGGFMVHHTIGFMRPFDPTGFRWMDKYIFPGGYLPTLSEINKAAASNDLIIEDVQNIGPDYDKTLMAWHANFEKAYPKLDHKRYDERFRRMWEFYLLGCAGSFRTRSSQLWQVVIRRRERSTTYVSPR